MQNVPILSRKIKHNSEIMHNVFFTDHNFKMLNYRLYATLEQYDFKFRLATRVIWLQQRDYIICLLHHKMGERENAAGIKYQQQIKTIDSNGCLFMHYFIIAQIV